MIKTFCDVCGQEIKLERENDFLGKVEYLEHFELCKKCSAAIDREDKQYE